MWTQINNLGSNQNYHCKNKYDVYMQKVCQSPFENPPLSDGINLTTDYPTTCEQRLRIYPLCNHWCEKEYRDASVAKDACSLLSREQFEKDIEIQSRGDKCLFKQ